MHQEAFGRLLKAGIGSIVACEGTTAPVVEEQLARQLGLSAASIQRYKAGYIPPDDSTVRLLAEASVRRGLMGLEWLTRFLHVARYPQPEALIQELLHSRPCAQAQRVYQNLPAPAYGQFVMRQQAFAELAQGLGSRSPVVVIVGLGGSGKSSLACEAARRCLANEQGLPQFSAAVWVSDKARPGSTSLGQVLDAVAHTLDYPAVAQLADGPKRQAVAQLLRSQRVLVLVDNFETIGDGALLEWLLNLPEPSKALITSRAYGRKFWRGGWPVELRGMTQAESGTLIEGRLRELRFGVLSIEQALVERLVTVTDGNPQAIKMVLGLLKQERRPLTELIEDLCEARIDLFDDLFAHAWQLLDEPARRLLLVAPFFHDCASAAALGAAADVAPAALAPALAQLHDLALLDEQYSSLDAPPRYGLHALVRAFAGARLRAEPNFERAARSRWLSWYAQRASQHDLWSDLTGLAWIDQETDNLLAAITWARASQRHASIRQLAPVAARYYSTRAMWERNLAAREIEREAARALGDADGEVAIICDVLEIHALQGDHERATECFHQLARLAERAGLAELAKARYCQALVVYYLRRGDIEEANRQAHLPAMFAGDAPYVLPWSMHLQGLCLYHKGELAAARERWAAALAAAQRCGYLRGAMFAYLGLATVALDEGDLATAEQLLAQGRTLAQQQGDRRVLAPMQHLAARLAIARRRHSEAHAEFHSAIELFERLGMRHELAEARREMTTLCTAVA